MLNANVKLLHPVDGKCISTDKANVQALPTNDDQKAIDTFGKSWVRHPLYPYFCTPLIARFFVSKNLLGSAWLFLDSLPNRASNFS